MTDPAEALGLAPDPGDYNRTRPQRWSQPLADPVVTTLVWLGMLVVGFVGMAGISAGLDAARQQDERKDGLIELIAARQERADGLAGQLDELRNRVSLAQENADDPALRAAVDRVAAGAGMTAVRGPGVLLTFDDADTCRGDRQQDCRILDVDLQLAVNTLNALGAEAIAINSERVISTTAVRGAGLSVLVNYRVLSAPYVVEAIGNADALADGVEASQLGQDFAYWRDRYGLGFDLTESDDLLLPAFSGTIRLRNADVTAGEIFP